MRPKIIQHIKARFLKELGQDCSIELSGSGDIPLAVGDEVFGHLRLENNDHKSEHLSAIAQQAAALLRLATRLDTADALKIEHCIASLHQSKPYFDWCGLYYVEKESLYLGPFRGALTPHAIIQNNHGICGAAIGENRTLNIKDVAADSRYLSCDTRTRSELVVPIRDKNGVAIAELDLDSHTKDAFSTEDVQYVEDIANQLQDTIIKLYGAANP